MKNLTKLFSIILIMLFTVPVLAETGVTVENISGSVKDKDVVIYVEDAVDVSFNELNQAVTYKVKLKNNTKDILYTNDLLVEGLSEEFIAFSLLDESLNGKIEPGETEEITFEVKTLDISQAGRNVDDEVTLKFVFNKEVIKNPQTNSNVFVIILLVITLLLTFSTMFSKLDKKKKLSILIVGMLVCGTTVVSANDSMTVELKGKVKYTSQNLMQTSGIVMDGYKASYINSVDVWKYYDKVKNIVISDDKTKPEDFVEKFDLTTTSTNRVLGYLIDNGDSKTPYDLYIVSEGIIYAPEDATGLFSFPNVETINGLEFVEFENTKVMTGMFIGNEKLTSVNTTSIDTSSATDTSYMFNGCDKLKVSDADFDLENVSNISYMFEQKLYDLVKNGSISDKWVSFANSFSTGNAITGKYMMENTKNDEMPIYYYRGEITDNNVLFGGYCWKMVRTTETGGVKLIYNGIPNNEYTPVARDVYVNVINSSSAPYSFNSTSLKWSSVNKTNNSSSSIDFSVATAGNYVIRYEIFSENNYDVASFYLDDKLIKTVSGIEKGIVDLGNITTTNKITVKYSKDGSTNIGNDSVNFYVASGTKRVLTCDNTGTASQIRTSSYNTKSTSPAYVGYMYGDVYTIGESDLSTQAETYLYGNDVEWNGSKYKLIDTKSSSNWSTDRETLATKYHYTCFNSTGECESVYYISHYYNESKAYYLTLTSGKDIEDAKEAMFTNKTSSLVKTRIDDWYKNNLNGYTSQLEDTVWCNDRTIVNGVLSSKDSNSKIMPVEINEVSGFGAVSRNRLSAEHSIACPNVRDSFTVDEANGNGKLKYPVGLLTADEYGYAGVYPNGASSYLETGQYTLTMSPYSVSEGGSSMFIVYASGSLLNRASSQGGAVRPAISLKSGINYVSGLGTVDNPYIAE